LIFALLPCKIHMYNEVIRHMKLEFWLDYLNPICYLQHRTLEAIVESKSIAELDILYRSYEMKPGFNPSQGHCIFEVIKSHYKLSKNEMELKFNDLLKDLKPVKVFDAHRLSHLAKKYHLGYAYHQLLLDSYYIQKLDISHHHVLIEIGVQIGLPESEIKFVLESDFYEEQVSNNRENAISKGIYELPHMRIEGKHHLSGYQSSSQILKVIEEVQKKITVNEHCIGEHCQRKKAF
jgi:predicted DsbA family dithiol-disulfide isomerase